MLFVAYSLFVLALGFLAGRWFYKPQAPVRDSRGRFTRSSHYNPYPAPTPQV
jgi:hypothetical protein